MKMLLLTLACFLASCSQSPKSSDKQETLQADSVLSFAGTKKLLMGEGYRTYGYIRYTEENGKAFLVQGNEREKIIKTYDYLSGKVLSESALDAGEGELYAHHPDTAFVIDRSKGPRSVWFGRQAENHHRALCREDESENCKRDGAESENGKQICYRI